MTSARPSGDAGASLAELLVVALLVGVLGLVVTATSVRGLETVRAGQQRSADTALARVALEAMTGSLRSAVDPDGSTKPLTMLDATSGTSDVTFYANVYLRGTRSATTAPARVRYVVESGDLAEYVTEGVRDATTGDPSWPGTPRRRVLARGVVPDPAGTPLFTYLPRRESPEPPPVADATGTVTAYGQSNVGSVELALSVRSPGAGRAVKVLGRVTVVNSRKDSA